MTAYPTIERPDAVQDFSFLSAVLGPHRRRPSVPVTSTRDAINVMIGNRIRSLRIVQGKTQVALGNALGLSNQQVQKYERGANSLNVERLWVIADYLGVDIHYLLAGIEEAALAVQPGGKASEDVTYRRLRLEVAEALRQVKSQKMLKSMLQLLRAMETESEAEQDAEDNDG